MIATKKKAETKTPAKPGKQPEVTRRGAKVVTIGTPAEPVHGKLGAKWCDRGNRGDRVLVIKERVADVLATKRVYDKTVPGYVDKPVRQAMWACEVVSGENRSCHDSTAHTMKRVFIRDDNLGRLFVPYAVKHPPKPEELHPRIELDKALTERLKKAGEQPPPPAHHPVPGARPPAGDGMVPLKSDLGQALMDEHEAKGGDATLTDDMRANTGLPLAPDANCVTQPDGGCVGGLAAGLPQCTHDPRES